MAVLKAIIAKLDEVEEAYRGLYVQKGDKFEIQIEGMKTQGDIDRVNIALTKERGDHSTARNALKEATDKLAGFGELKPEDVTAKLERLETLEAAGTPDIAKNFDKLVNERVEAVVGSRIKAETAKFTKQVTDLTAELGTTKTANEGFKTQITARTIDDAVRSAATVAKIAVPAVADALIIARSEFKLVDGRVQTEDGRTPDQWIEGRKESSPHWWPAAQGAGAGGSNGEGVKNGDNPFSHAGWNLTKQGALVLSNSAQAQRLAEQAGTTVGGQRPAAPK